MKSLRCVTLALPMLICPLAATAEWYAGLGGFYGQLTEDNFQVPSGGDYDPALGYSASVGYTRENVVWELGYLAFDDFEYQSSVLTNSSFTMEGVQFSLGGQRDFGRFTVDMRIGAYVWQADGVYEGTDVGQVDDGVSPTAQLRLRLPLGERVSLFTEYQYLHETLGGSAVNLLGGGVRVGF